MCGGREYRAFFLGQATEFTKRHTDDLPDAEYTGEELEAGFADFSKTFNFYATLQVLCEGDILRQKQVLKLQTRDVYFNIKFRAWKAYHQREYERIMRAKNKT